MPPISATITSDRSRARRNAIACLAGLAVHVLGIVAFVVATEGPSKLRLALRVAAEASFGPFGSVALDPAVPKYAVATVAVLAWTAWVTALSRGWLRPLPWGCHLTFPIAWGLVGVFACSMAALRYT